MDYSKMTKEQLINKLNEQVHLAAAVEAKDAEIASIKKAMGDEIARTKNNMLEELSNVKKALETAVQGNIELKEQAKHLVTKEQIELATKKILEDRNNLIAIVKDYRMLFTNTLKNMQGGLDNAILADELLSAKLGIGG